MKDENVPVSGRDELSFARSPGSDYTRRLGEFSPTNMPLSAAEIEQRNALSRNRNARRRVWVPRSLDAIHDMAPIAEVDLLKRSA